MIEERPVICEANRLIYDVVLTEGAAKGRIMMQNHCILHIVDVIATGATKFTQTRIEFPVAHSIM